jgi:hypothetical protein
MPHDPLVHLRGDRAKLPLAVRAAGRYFLTGAPLRGAGDNATFLHRATVDYRARPYVTLSAPVWQRLARRHAAVTVPLWLAIAGFWVGWWLVIDWMAVLVLVGSAWAGRATVRALSRGKANREWTDPAARVLASMVGGRYVKKSGRQAIELPAGWGKTGNDKRGTVRVNIPAGTALSPALKGKITSNVGARLGIPEPVQGDWREAGTHVCVELSAAPLPPAEVTWESMRTAMAECADDEVVVGRKAGGALVKVSLVEDAPHFLMSGAAGTGKSVLARVFLAQRLERGDGLIITDPKRFSHWRWAGGGKLATDRVIYAYRDEDLHEAWLAVGEEIKRRIELPEDDLAGQRRVFVLGEEMNVQTKKLARYWKGQRKELMIAAKQAQADDGPYDPADLDPPLQSPAIVAMQELVCMGRELRMHMVAAAQRASAGIFGGGGGDIRESFQGGRFIAKWDRKLWKMLVDTIAYVAWPGGKAGIWGLARPDGFEIFRVPWLSEDDALSVVLSGRPVSGPVLGPQSMSAGQVDSDVVRPALVQAVKLAEAIGHLPGDLSLSSVRKASTRDRTFPESIGRDGSANLYDLSALIYWADRKMLA